jgi:hypothetical protein
VHGERPFFFVFISFALRSMISPRDR